jgi:hypothetical protein
VGCGWDEVAVYSISQKRKRKILMAEVASWDSGLVFFGDAFGRQIY